MAGNVLKLRLEDVPDARGHLRGEHTDLFDDARRGDEQTVERYCRGERGNIASRPYIASPADIKVALSRSSFFATRTVTPHQPGKGIARRWVAVRPCSCARSFIVVSL